MIFAHSSGPIGLVRGVLWPYSSECFEAIPTEADRGVGWGGKRKGAGRPPIAGRRRPVAHRGRGIHKAAHPVHLTLRARRDVPALRSDRMFPAVRDAIGQSSRAEFRVVDFSVQDDHLHLIVEAQDAKALSSGARGLSIRIARAINNACRRRGPVWGDRYHTHALKTPRETRHAIVYVLMNFRKHHPHDRQAIDPCSSAPWFDGFRHAPRDRADPSATWKARTWLASKGWRRHGLIDWRERPGERPRPR
jgi:putative transposase